MRSSKQMGPSGVWLFAVADGHNGQAAVRAVAALLPAELARQLGPQHTAPGAEAVRQALARTFLAVDEAVCQQFFQSGERGAGGRAALAGEPFVPATLAHGPGSTPHPGLCGGQHPCHRRQSPAA